MAGRIDQLTARPPGGEQQPGVTDHGLVPPPLLLLADEPAGYLDTANSDQVMMLLRNLVDERGQTILMVTHKVRHAPLADRLLRLRDGRVVEQQTLPRSRPPQKVLEDLESLS